jgi:hypothetical protein
VSDVYACARWVTMQSARGNSFFDEEEEKTEASARSYDQNPGRTFAKALSLSRATRPSEDNRSAHSWRHVPQRFTHLTLSQETEVSINRCLFLELGKLVQIHLLDYWNRPIGIFGQLAYRGGVLVRDWGCYDQQIR